MKQNNAPIGACEKLVTLRQAATALGLPYYKVQRAAKTRVFETYTIYNSRRLVRLSEVIAAIQRSANGGSQ